MLFMQNELLAFMQHPIVQKMLVLTGIGLGIGVVAKIIIPGSEQIGWLRTICLGWLGCFLGNYLAPLMFDWPIYSIYSMQGIGVSIVGAVVLVVINRIVTKS